MRTELNMSTQSCSPPSSTVCINIRLLWVVTSIDARPINLNSIHKLTQQSIRQKLVMEADNLFTISISKMNTTLS